MLETFRERGVELVGSPDYFTFKQELFGIDDARKINDLAARKAFGEKKVLLISPERITPEAQNALLKTFEEPVEGTHFFLNLRDESVVIPTLRSRVEVVRLSGQEVEKEAGKFLAGSLKDRLNFAKKFAEAEKNLSSFLDDLLKLVGNLEQKKEIFKVRLVSDQRGASSRLVLEHLALVLP